MFCVCVCVPVFKVPARIQVLFPPLPSATCSNTSWVQFRYFPAVLRRPFTKHYFKYFTAKIQLFTFCQKCLSEFSLIHTHTHTYSSYLFSLHSLWGPKPFIVSQREPGTGISGRTHEGERRGRAQASRRRKLLPHIAAHIHLQNDGLSLCVPVDVSHQNEMACFL